MDTREKLIELLTDDYCPLLYMQGDVGNLADYLIKRGVIIKGDCEDCASKTTRVIDKLHGEIAKLSANQRWIPVTERLPVENGYYLCDVCFSSVADCKSYRRMILYFEDNVWIDMPNCFRTRKPTHWMPLPEPPKEVE